MVTNVTSLGRNGLYDWLIQRASALVMTAYLVFLVGFLASNPDLQYGDWQGLFAKTWMKVFSLITLISLCAHAWIGMWTISTDYLTGRMFGGCTATLLRLLFQGACFVVLISYFVWCVRILWSI